MTYASIEFLLAQSPIQIKGLTVCILFGFIGFFAGIGFAFGKIILSHPFKVFPGCAFYHHVIYLLSTVIIFILFVLVSKWYKLRKRDDIVPIHMFAENYFEKNYEQERRYLQQHSDIDSDK